MKEKNIAEIITIDGSALLAQFQVNSKRNKPVCLDVDLFKNISDYSESALLYQVRKVMEKDFSRNLFKEVIFFVDFMDFFKYQDSCRNELFENILENGFDACWPNSEEVFHYVPFEKSQSQAKNCMISFIQKELFLPVRRRLDLDIGFNDYTYGAEKDPFGFPLKNTIPQLSKLYAYRGLYLSEATRLEDIRELLTADRIVILKEEKIRFSHETAKKLGMTEYYTARKAGETKEGKYILEPVVATDLDKPYSFDPFDGVGLVSPRGAAILNRSLYGKKFADSRIDPENTSAQELLRKDMAVSFQFRLPFCKGMLHTVDFHRFLREEMALGEDLIVTDIFGKERNLKNADIILNQTLFKLCGLVTKDLEDPEKRERFIDHYFKMLNDYDHSIYIVKTDKEQRRTGYGKLTAQILNTLPLTQEGFEHLVSRHKDRAQQYQMAPIILSGGNLPILEEESGEITHKYLKAEPCLALDHYVEDLVNSCRKQALHRLYQGKLDVEGDMRFLSRDLLYYLRRIGLQCGGTGYLPLISRGQVYLPDEKAGAACALFRSPHLCPNENVLAETSAKSDLYETYLGHLHRVIFVAGDSQMPDALGGADFDGDMVVVAFQQEVVEACRKKCYREDGLKGLQLIQIPSFKRESTDSSKCRYVNVETIQNTFSSQIGLISNATMRICAAEAVSGQELPYPSQFCAILNGVEIDAAKTGIRPDLSQVSAFTGKLKIENEDPEDDEESDSDIARAMQLVKTYLKVSNDLKHCDLPRISVKEKDQKYTVNFGKEEITQFKNETGNVPFVYQLLIQWAEAFGTKPEENDRLKKKVVGELYKKFPDTKKRGDSTYPRDDILKNEVFACPKKIPASQSDAINKVLDGYTTVKKAVDTIQRNSNPSQARTLRRNLLHLLRYKYDDVDITEKNKITIRQVGDSMGLQLKQTLNTTEELSEVLESNFYGPDTNAEHWLFCREIDKNAALGKAIGNMDALSAQIACDRGFHGYDLMFFALREQYAQSVADDFRKTLRTKTGDDFLDALYHVAAEAMDRGYSASQIANRHLPEPCRKQLETLLNETDPNALIPLVYKQTTEKSRAIFWRLFSWDEIEAYLRTVKANA